MYMNRTLYIIIISLLICFGIDLPSYAQQSNIIEDFKPVCDTLSKAIEKRTTVRSELKLKNVMRRGRVLDFYFTISLADCPWHAADAKWLKDTLKHVLPHEYRHYGIGAVYSNRIPLDKLTVPALTFNGKPAKTAHTAGRPDGVLIRKEDRMNIPHGLQDRHIALWHSHGRYFDVNTEMWKWQRPNMFNICEDLFTQSFVLPYLVPMLENSGAYVMLPRERDIQTYESIADNDPVHSYGMKTAAGFYTETGPWDTTGVGFGHKPTYFGEEDPFASGTARKAAAIRSDAKKGEARIIWRADIPKRGEYSVYISYKSLPESVSAARYTIHHMGGSDSFIVNQKLSGSTWVYLGTFEFAEGTDGYVELTNRIPKGYTFDSKGVVTADAVRFGGGMGNIARSRKFDPENDTIPHYEPIVSGLPRSMEGARYWLQWAGVPASIYSQNEGENDYKDDFMCRGDWVAWMKDEKGVPFDLALGFHSDAGVTQDSTVIGTLAIYTSRSESKTTFADGKSRLTSRELADQVQSQIVHDLRSSFNPQWSRRCTWDRGYRESRTPTCPSMLLELLSHQNFRDMLYGLDPSFRFATSRAVYKGILKYLSNRYNQPYIVQPLPVEDLAVYFEGETFDKAILSWNEVEDPIEPTAKAEGYILQTRIDNGAFDSGVELKEVYSDGTRLCTSLKIEPGHIYSYRIVAFNKGGKSFASEVASIGSPATTDSEKQTRKVLVVNNFDRVSGPAFFENESHAGFLSNKESGVPMNKEIAFTGEMYDFDKASQYTSDTNPGFGASYNDNFGEIIAGNTSDYAHIHGKALIAAGHPFCTCSKETFCQDSTLADSFWTVDLVCGKQLTTVTPDGLEKYQVFPYDLQDAIRRFTSKGGNMLVSGAYIATDIWDKVYPVQTDTTYRKISKDFAGKVLGYKFNTNYGSRNGSLKMTAGGALKWTDLSGHKYIYSAPDPDFYCVEHPDGIAPASKSAQTIVRYADTGAPAGIAFKGNQYRTVCFGFPLEALKEEKDLHSIIGACLMFIAE